MNQAAIDTVAQVTEQGNLTVITSGPLPPNPAELLDPQRMRGVLERLALEAELIILDSPPLLAVTDSAVLSAMVDGTLLVLDPARSCWRAVRAARQSSARAGANVLEVALNRVPRQAGASYHGYGGDRTGKDAERVLKRRTPRRAVRSSERAHTAAAGLGCVVARPAFASCEASGCTGEAGVGCHEGCGAPSAGLREQYERSRAAPRSGDVLLQGPQHHPLDARHARS